MIIVMEALFNLILSTVLATGQLSGASGGFVSGALWREKVVDRFLLF
jgi:hypothetical protein